MSDFMDNPMEALPKNLRDFINKILNGEVSQYLIVAQRVDGGMSDCFEVLDEESMNIFTMVGTIEYAKRDYMRCYGHSRVEYIEKDIEDDE